MPKTFKSNLGLDEFDNVEDVKNDPLFFVKKLQHKMTTKVEIYEDENGNHFSFTGFHFASFAGKIPDWYLKCGLCSMEWQETKNIGKYLTIIE